MTIASYQRIEERYSSSDYENYGTVYSQVVPFTVNPTCTQVVVKAGHYVKKLVRRVTRSSGTATASR